MPDSIDNDRFRNLLLAWPDKAIEYLYEDYYESLVSISEWKTHDHKASEDIVQEVFALIWKNHESIALREDLLIGHYLFTIVKNKSINHYNETIRLNKDQISYFIAERAGHGSPIESEIISSEKKELIWQIVSTFPQREKQCLTMKFQNNMTIDEIALQMKVSKKAVERSVTSAYKRLRKYKSSLL